MQTTKQKKVIELGAFTTDARPAGLPWRDWLRMAMVLFKLRVVFLLLLAAVAGAFLGAQGWPGFGPLLLLLITGGLAASGASALNQYIERQADEAMSRTRNRPLVTGQFPRPGVVIPLGITMILLPTLAVLPFNPALSFFLAFGAFIYVGIYTLWLKPRTLLNIVIGGAAGSAAVMSGGAVVHAWQDPAVIVFALLVFLWTPSHFWSLAILYRDDYQKANVPMLPARTGPRAAGVWVLVHTLATGMAALLLALSPALGWLYFIPAFIITVDLLRRNLLLIKNPTRPYARSFFVASNIYLMVIIAATCVSVLIHSFITLRA